MKGKKEKQKKLGNKERGGVFSKMGRKKLDKRKMMRMQSERILVVTQFVT
jgi:hypothetical protein